VTSVKQKHIHAITRAQNLLETGVNVSNNEKLRESIKKDILILCELRQILFYALENPTLPFNVEAETEADPIVDQIENEPDGAF